MIAIKSMKEMPTDCFNCHLTIHECHVTMFREDRRADGCPLVEIVTCKDCKYYRNGLEHCTNWVMSTNEDFYCADAERK